MAGATFSTVSDKQFFVLLGIAAVGVGVVGYMAYVATKKTAEVVENTIEAGKEVVDSAEFLAEYYVDEIGDAVSSFFENDEFDKKYRHQTSLSDENYKRWKAAVLAGQIENTLEG